MSEVALYNLLRHLALRRPCPDVCSSKVHILVIVRAAHRTPVDVFVRWHALIELELV
jgi:hypothetical protein